MSNHSGSSGESDLDSSREGGYMFDMSEEIGRLKGIFRGGGWNACQACRSCWAGVMITL